MKTSAEGRKAIMQREGTMLRAYRDSKGVWTIGTGHAATSGLDPIPRAGMTITREQADEILSRDLAKFEAAVRAAVRVVLTQTQFDALVSLAFNIGASGFAKSSVVRRLNEGNYRGAADAFLLWNKPPELMPRRRAERAQFLSDAGTHIPGEPVRFMPKTDLHNDEEVTPEYLRASDSRTMAGLDSIKASVGTVSGAVVAAGGIAENISDIHDGVSTIGQAASDTKDMAGWFMAHWPMFLIAMLLLVALAAAYRIWRASEIVLAARVDDAAYSPKPQDDA